MWSHRHLENRELLLLIKKEKITQAGNSKLKIYGTLTCKSGKRMKDVNRVFFVNRKEAINMGYRPCGHCLRSEYIKWKNEIA